MTLADDARRLNLRTRRRREAGARPQRRRARLPALILLTDETRLADPSAAVARLPRGAAVILRHYGLTAVERAALARRLRRITRTRGVLLLLAATDRTDEALALTLRADGIHVPEWRVRQGNGPVMHRRRPGWLVTAAAHSLLALRRAAAFGADAALLSPVFATASHPITSLTAARPLGVLRFAAWSRLGRLPVYALGGIDARSAARLRPTRACGLAGIGGFVESLGSAVLLTAAPEGDNARA